MELLLWSAYDPCAISRPLALPPLRLHLCAFWKSQWVLVTAKVTVPENRPLICKARSTYPFVLASSYGCRQPSAMGKIMKPSFWWLGMYRNTPFCKPHHVFAPQSLSHWDERLGPIFCNHLGLSVRLTRAITSKRHSMSCYCSHCQVSDRACFESCCDQILHACTHCCVLTTTMF